MSTDETIELLVDLHINNQRQGPGSPEDFSLALQLSGISVSDRLQIADIGCGTGSASVLLAQNTCANITAVDLLPQFLDKLNTQTTVLGLQNRITTLCADMGDLPFHDEQFDVLWSEGAIYNIGYTSGIELWKRFLKPNGVIVLTEITWIRSPIPDSLYKHWTDAYSEIAPASEKIQTLENNNFTVLGYFPLQRRSWIDNYYTPLESGFDAFLARHNHAKRAVDIIEGEKEEITLYNKYAEYYSYGCYVAKLNSPAI